MPISGGPFRVLKATLFPLGKASKATEKREKRVSLLEIEKK